MADRKDDWQDVAKGLQAKAAPRERSVDSVVLDAAQEIVRLRALVNDLAVKLVDEKGARLAAEQAAQAAGDERDRLKGDIERLAGAVRRSSAVYGHCDEILRLASAYDPLFHPSPVAGGPGGAERSRA